MIPALDDSPWMAEAPPRPGALPGPSPPLAVPPCQAPNRKLRPSGLTLWPRADGAQPLVHKEAVLLGIQLVLHQKDLAGSLWGIGE